MRRFWLLMAAVTLSAGIAAARTAPRVHPAVDYKNGGITAQKLCGADRGERLPMPAGREPDGPRRDEDIGDPQGLVEIGDDYVVGYTYYDYQHNGSIGKMIAKDSQGNIHFTWMCGYNSDNSPRHQVYNYLSDGELMIALNRRGVVDSGSRSGYGVLALLPEDERAGVFYHVMGYEGAPNPEWSSWAQAIDFLPGIGAFASTYPPTWDDVQILWPKGCFDRNNIGHIIGREYSDQMWSRIAYSQGVAADNDFLEWEWYDEPVNIDTASVISPVASASVTSDRVVLAWHHNRVGADPDGVWANQAGYYQKNNDLRYIVSEDGEDWDWENGIRSITRIVPPDPDLLPDMDEAVGDTFRPYCDIDIQFDPWGDDNLYAVFAACGFWESPDPDPDPAIGATAEQGHLWFWNGEEDTITLVYDGWYFNRTDNGDWMHSRCGGWRMNADRGSIAFNPDEPGTIYVVWVNFPKIMEPVYDEDGEFVEWQYLEGAQDTSSLGFSNAEIMVSISTDYGITWREPVNITETRWEENQAPDPGECLSENWVSAAYLADDTLHIQYILDLEAGGWPQGNEGEATNNPVIYHRVAIDDLPLNDPIAMPRDGFMFHNYPEEREWFLRWVEMPDEIMGQEGERFEFWVSGESSDENAELTIAYHSEDLPDAARFEDNGDGSGTFSWTPTYDDAGEYAATFTLSDGENELEAEVAIIVNNVNRAPVWEEVPEFVVGNEGEAIAFEVRGSDPDGDSLAITAQSDDLPAGWEFTDNGDGSGAFIWQTTNEDAGGYSATFTLSDGENELEAEVAIIVNNVNRAPVWEEVPEFVVGNEGEAIAFEVRGSDADGDSLAITAQSDNLPAGWEFTDNGDGSGTFSWTPTYDDAGVYNAVFTVSDGEWQTPALVIIVVQNTNRSPEVTEPIGDLAIDEDYPRTIVAVLDTVFADPDGEELAFQIASSPAELQLELSDLGELSAQPIGDFCIGDPGLLVVLTAADSVGEVAVDSFQIAILPVNDPPEPFDLLAPEDGYRVAYDPDSLALLEFVWEEAIQNPWETDSVYYWVVFTSGMVQYTVGPMDSIHYAVPIQALADSMGFSREAELTFTWLVWAQDSEEHVFASNAPWTFTIPALRVSGRVLNPPDDYYLSANYPNPFNVQTRLRFGLPVAGEVSLEVWDVNGRRWSTLESGYRGAGHYETVWDAAGLPGGVYIIAMKSGSFTAVRKAVVIK